MGDRKLELARRQYVDRLRRKNDERVYNCEPLLGALDIFVSWLFKLYRNCGESGLERTHKKEISVVQMACTSVERRKFLYYVGAFDDLPVEGEAIH